MSNANAPDWRQEAALGLPHGSVRALLALTITAGIWIWLLYRPDAAVPTCLRDLMFIIMGYYFAARARAEPAGGPPPLYLPRGSVRTLLVVGFLCIGAVLFRQHHLASAGRPNAAAVTLILVGGFLLGAVASRVSPRKIPRFFEDIRAVASLAAGGLLLLLVFGIVSASRLGIEEFLLRHDVEDILAALVGFYFGSRS